MQVFGNPAQTGKRTAQRITGLRLVDDVIVPGQVDIQSGKIERLPVGKRYAEHNTGTPAPVRQNGSGIEIAVVGAPVIDEFECRSHVCDAMRETIFIEGRVFRRQIVRQFERYFELQPKPHEVGCRDLAGCVTDRSGKDAAIDRRVDTAQLLDRRRGQRDLVPGERPPIRVGAQKPIDLVLNVIGFVEGLRAPITPQRGKPGTGQDFVHDDAGCLCRLHGHRLLMRVSRHQFDRSASDCHIRPVTLFFIVVPEVSRPAGGKLGHGTLSPRPTGIPIGQGATVPVLRRARNDWTQLMQSDKSDINRRSLLMAGAGLAVSISGVSSPATAESPGVLRRDVPSGGASVPAIGMGSWITFNVGDNERLRNARTEVLRSFFELGGGMIDSSPMYGSSEAVLGHGLSQLGHPESLFSATKVWTRGQRAGVAQMTESEALWATQSFDLMQIHNMLDWQTHYETLSQWKAEGRIRYLGITTSHGRRHRDLERALTSAPFDFVQLTYNVLDREVENRLLPLASERGIGVIVNRPFRRGALFDRIGGTPLPAWASEIDCTSWAAFLLKFVISHPAVTCAIPATSQVAHMQENMAAMSGRLPDEALRARMAETVRTL